MDFDLYNVVNLLFDPTRPVRSSRMKTDVHSFRPIAIVLPATIQGKSVFTSG